MLNYYVIGLGSSHPCGKIYLDMAFESLKALHRAKLLSQSDQERSGGVGTDDPLVFVNAAACLSSSLHPSALWFEMTSIERKLGRIRTKINGPRTIDLDLLWWSCGDYSDAWITLPHPRLHERKFAIDLAMQALRNAGLDANTIKLRGQKAPESSVSNQRA